MSTKKKIVSFSFDELVGEVYRIGESRYVLEANYLGDTIPVNVHIYGSNPKRKSYGTSHLNFEIPYQNMEVAFQNTPNISYIKLDGQRDFHFEFEMPNVYYHHSKIVLPHLFMRINEHKYYVPLKRE